ncbi:MAG: tryptophan-rich sensory protein [Clostridia bacterium]|nr:tryptophan-rich sensory protein [Clostridia bacterium]
MKKIRFFSSCREELHRIGLAEALICGSVTAFASVLVRGVSGSPYRCINFLHLHGVIPPVWLMSMLWFVWHFIIGATMGAVMGNSNFCCGIPKYRGGMFWVLMTVFGLIWYPMFFCAEMMFFSMLDVLVVLALSVICAIDFFRVYKLCGFVMALYSLWLLWMFTLNFRAFIGA